MCRTMLGNYGRRALHGSFWIVNLELRGSARPKHEFCSNSLAPLAVRVALSLSSAAVSSIFSLSRRLFKGIFSYIFYSDFYIPCIDQFTRKIEVKKIRDAAEMVLTSAQRCGSTHHLDREW
jgi:hypothetical protein